VLTRPHGTPLPLTPLPKEEGVAGAEEHHVSPYLSDGYPVGFATVCCSRLGKFLPFL